MAAPAPVLADTSSLCLSVLTGTEFPEEDEARLVCGAPWIDEWSSLLREPPFHGNWLLQQVQVLTLSVRVLSQPFVVRKGRGCDPSEAKPRTSSAATSDLLQAFLRSASGSRERRQDSSSQKEVKDEARNERLKWCID